MFLICDCFCHSFFTIFLTSGIETPDRNSQWYQHLLTLFGIFYESNTEGNNFWIMFICFTFLKCACFVLVSTSARFDFVKSPEVTQCGWLPSITKSIISFYRGFWQNPPSALTCVIRLCLSTISIYRGFWQDLSKDEINVPIALSAFRDKARSPSALTCIIKLCLSTISIYLDCWQNLHQLWPVL